MKLLTNQSILDSVITRYAIQYKTNKRLFDGRYSDDVLRQLKSLSPITREKVDEIIGNTSWTTEDCTECGMEILEAIQIDTNEDQLILCKNCVQKAASLFP